jgi:hypothetical protein
MNQLIYFTYLSTPIHVGFIFLTTFAYVFTGFFFSFSYYFNLYFKKFSFNQSFVTGRESSSILVLRDGLTTNDGLNDGLWRLCNVRAGSVWRDELNWLCHFRGKYT